MMLRATRANTAATPVLPPSARLPQTAEAGIGRTSRLLPRALPSPIPLAPTTGVLEDWDLGSAQRETAVPAVPGVPSGGEGITPEGRASSTGGDCLPGAVSGSAEGIQVSEEGASGQRGKQQPLLAEGLEPAEDGKHGRGRQLLIFCC